MNESSVPSDGLLKTIQEIVYVYTAEEVFAPPDVGEGGDVLFRWERALYDQRDAVTINISPCNSYLFLAI